MSNLRDINETLAMISEAARKVYSRVDAEYAASVVRQWLEQLEREVEELEMEDE